MPSDNTRICEIVDGTLGDAAIGGILADGVINSLRAALERRLTQAVSANGETFAALVTTSPDVPNGPTRERAKAIINEVWEAGFSGRMDPNGFARGIVLLTEACRRAGIDTWVNTTHYGVRYCEFTETIPVMTEDEIRQISKWGWSEENDAWFFLK